jgi:DNA-binding response OmpR family regulator
MDRRAHIVVVEDEATQRQLLVDYLDKQNFRVSAAGGGGALRRLVEVTAHREMKAFDRAIDLRIMRLRRKIEIDPAHPDSIRTARGVGYMFVPPKD